MSSFAKPLTVLLGLSAFGFTGYMLYLLFKKDFEDDELLEECINNTNTKTMRIKVPKDLVRGLIGRNGSNVKSFQDLSSTKINFEDHDNDVNEKTCVIRGSTEGCDVAWHLIQDFIKNQPVLESVDMWVPIGCIRNIIGRGGEKINEIRSLSGAKLTVIDDEKGATSKRIIIKGTKEQIKVAKSLIEEVVHIAQLNQQLIEDSLSRREPRAPSRSPEVVPKCEKISPILIPGLPDQFEVYVSAMETPSKFWLQIVGTKATELDCLVEEMTEYYNKPENRSQHQLNNISQGDLVAGIYPFDKKWYRAEVLSTVDESDGKIAKLYYVDYGDTDHVACKDLYELRTDFLRLHFQAIECFLARIDPVGDTWSEEAVDLFEELAYVAQWKKVLARIHGYTLKEKTRAKREGSPVPGVDLWHISNEKDIDIAQQLVKSGYAVYKKNSEVKTNSRTPSTSNVSVASSS